jgi:preprotein translocase subunit SecF
MLTVIGFSVQDTIAAYDRIRERSPAARRAVRDRVNRSLLEVLQRSLTTQLNAIFVMVSILCLAAQRSSTIAVMLVP